VIVSTAHQPPLHIRKVAIIGAGVAGRSFALACAAAGFIVVLEDVMPSNLRRAEAEYADAVLGSTFGALQLASTVEEAVREADIAIDFVPDELESKLEIFSMIDRMAPPKTILCTPSYALSITDLASCVYRPDRCIAVRGDLTANASDIRLLYPVSISSPILAATNDFMTALGFKPCTEPDPDVPMLMKNSPAVPA
jgi:3-hydroxybutyryl-CoA dehydrogenase